MKCIISWRAVVLVQHVAAACSFVPVTLRVGSTAAKASRITSLQKVVADLGYDLPCGSG